MRDRKPIPKNQSEVLQEQITPYLVNSGKPVSETIFDHNRGMDLSMKGDTVKDISIGLEDIDEAVLYYFNNIIKPTVVQDNNQMAVRTIFSTPERWKSVQADGFYRDGNSQIIIPLIVLSRNNVEKNRSLGNKLDGNKVHNYQVVGSKYNKRNAYDKFNILNNRIPSEQYYITAVPDYVTVTYSCIIFTNFIVQNNKIVEAIEFASDSYWGDPSRFKFKSSIDSFATTISMEAEGDRAAKTTFNITLNGYLIPNTVNKDLATTRSKFYTKSQVVFDLEVIDGNVNNNLYPMNGRINVTNSTSFVGGGSSIINVISPSINVEDIAYLNTNKQLIANTVTTNSATFVGTTILQPPNGSTIPATNINNFTFYIRGQYVPSSMVTLTISGGDVIFIFNTSSLGYTLQSNDEVIAIGKFQ